MYNLTGCYWIRNEAKFLPEYIEFHLLQGFDFFSFWQDGDTDQTAAVLEPYIEQGLVEYRTIPDHVTQRKNFWIMSQCIEEFRPRTKWLHFHAIDERLFNPEGRPLPDVLAEYELPEIAGVCTNWIQLHSGGQIEATPGLLMERFTLGQDQDPMHHVKTVVRPAMVHTHPIDTPHNFHAQQGTRTVNEQWEVVVGPFNGGQYTTDKLRNIHYATMSRDEYEQKMNKGVLDGVNTVGYRRADADQYWTYYHDNGSTEYTDLLKWVEPTRQAILKRYEGREHLLQYVNH
jgi:hypothetical protein